MSAAGALHNGSSANGGGGEPSTSSASPSSSLALGDLLLCVEHVVHAGGMGSLRVCEAGLAWLDGDERVRYSIGYGEIKMQRVSPASKAKVQLQVVPVRGDNATFQFAAPDGREAQMQSRETAKEVIQQRIAKAGLERAAKQQQQQQQAAAAAPSSDGKRAGAAPLSPNRKHRDALERKQKVLNENPRLAKLYEELVTNGIVSAKDFWNDIASETKSSSAPPKSASAVGISGSFLSDSRQMDGCNGIKFNLTADTRLAIFKTYPSVRQRHLELVPHEMDERTFWTNFFQSHYFHRDRSAQLADPKDVFAACLKLDEADMRQLFSTARLGAEFDVQRLRDPVDEWSAPADAPGPSSQSASSGGGSGKRLVLSKGANVMRQFNYHSNRVLAATVGDEAAPSKAKTRRLEPAADLQQRAGTSAAGGSLFGGGGEHVPLKLRTDKRAPAQDTGGEGVHDHERCAAAGVLWASEPHSPSFTVDEALSAACQAALDDFNASLSAQTGDLPDQSAVKEIRSLHMSLHELLRHFWHCFPATTPEAETKLDRMVVTLRNFETRRLQPSLAKLHKPALGAHLRNMLQAAFDRHGAWSARRKK